MAQADITWSNVSFQLASSDPAESGEEDYDVDLESKEVDDSNPEIDPGFETAVKGASGVAKGVTVVGFLINLPVAITMIKIMRMIDYLVYIDVALPPKLRKFLEIIGGSVLEISYNMLEVDEEIKLVQEQNTDSTRILGEEEKNGQLLSTWRVCTAPKKFGEEEASCFLFNNVGPQVTLFLFLILLRIIVSLIASGIKSTKKSLSLKSLKGTERATNESFQAPLKEGVKAESMEQFSLEKRASKPSGFSKYALKMDSYLSVGFFFYFFKATQLDVLIASTLYAVVYFKKTSRLTLTYVSDTTSIGRELTKPNEDKTFSPSMALFLLSILFIFTYMVFVSIASMFGAYLEVERQKEQDSMKSTKVKRTQKHQKSRNRGIFQWKDRYKKWIFLREEINPKVSLWKKFSPEFTLIGDFLIPIFIVMAHSQPLV